jgi:signal transduction histidine kinase/DNA-binding NarL/FixJ family response regulator
MQDSGRATTSASYIVLLIEDDEGAAEALSASLSTEEGLRVLHVPTLADGLLRVAAGNIDVVLLDLVLPDAIGLAGLRRLRSAAPWIPILVLTAIRDERLATQVLHHGAQDHLVKGDLDGPQIARRIRDAFERQHYMMRASVLAQEHANRALAEERRVSWLAEAGQILGSSIDYEETLQNIHRAAVGNFADTCIVELSVPRQAAELRDPVDVVQAARIAKVLSSGCSWFDEDVADALVVPMSIGNRRIGAIAMTFSSARGRLSQPERVIGEEFGHRAALALENASLYQQARAAIALREEFLSIASHELRTPLSTLQLQIQVLQFKFAGTSPPERAEINERLGKCLSQTARVTRLVNTLLDVSLIASGQIFLKLEEVELSGVVRETFDRFVAESTTTVSNLTFKNGTKIVGKWDRMRLEQVVTNLITNGVKYGSGTAVEVILAAVGAQAVLTVRDHGIGIAQQDLNRIFGRFERAASVRHYSGLGLGLYVTRQIVEAHGGTIAVESELGKGSLFTVKLPLLGQRSAGVAR